MYLWRAYHISFLLLSLSLASAELQTRSRHLYGAARGPLRADPYCHEIVQYWEEKIHAKLAENWHRPSGNGPWPDPQSMTQSNITLSIDPTNFSFVTNANSSCDIIHEAIKRYKIYTFLKDCSIANRRPGEAAIRSEKHCHAPIRNGSAQITQLTIQLLGNCQRIPHLDMDEMYTLHINTDDYPKQAMLISSSVWGLLRGLETFSQLVWFDPMMKEFRINSTMIIDFPRFSHRGYMLDTSRHFLPKQILKGHLEAMEFNKMNVLHWHIVDDQSFPFVSEKFPDLSDKGAFYSTHIYSPQDVAEVIEYGRLRGIRVMPEFDSPGHTLSWGKGQPGILTQCYNSKGQPDGTQGPIDPSKPEVYKFMDAFFAEVSQRFQDNYIHLGGDEVSFDCWMSNPDVKAFMKSLNISGDYAALETYYLDQITEIVTKLNKSYIAWQEVYDNGVTLQPSTVVHVWKDPYPRTWQDELAAITNSGYRALLSSPWYLNYISYGPDWPGFYMVDPRNFSGPNRDLVIGGEVCMWSEYVDGADSISRTWPRASAAAEALWSSEGHYDYVEAVPRLEEQRCRMQRRGIKVEPINGPGTCPCDYTIF